MYKLTIAIPTYNRSKSLRGLLEKLCAQSEIECVEVLISDNCSSDNTEFVIKSFRSKLNINFFKNDHNIGFDRNYINCLEKSSGEYVWIIGDDDQPSEYAVSNILREIDEKSFDLLILNGGDRDLSGRVVPRIKYHVEDKPSSISSVFEQIGWHICWIGTFVLKKASIDVSGIRNNELNQFAHLSLMIRSSSLLTKIFYFNEVLIVTTINNSDYFKKANMLIDIFGLHLFNTLNIYLNQGISKKGVTNTIRGFNKYLRMFTFMHLLLLRKNNGLNIATFLKKLPSLQKLNRLSFLFILSFLVPTPFITVVANLRKKLLIAIN